MPWKMIMQESTIIFFLNRHCQTSKWKCKCAMKYIFNCTLLLCFWWYIFCFGDDFSLNRYIRILIFILLGCFKLEIFGFHILKLANGPPQALKLILLWSLINSQRPFILLWLLNPNRETKRYFMSRVSVKDLQLMSTFFLFLMNNFL